MNDARFMRLALQQARRGLGQTSPNPAVGAVVVKDGRVLAAGFHRRAGLPHAEVEALHALPSKKLARGASLYVTLEPCTTHGRTPPCVQAIRQAGLARVIIGANDPNPKHAGRAAGWLEAHGIATTSGVLAGECAALNRAYHKWIVQKMPWVIAKYAMTLDGRLTLPPGESRWLTSEEARSDVHRLRAQVDAILIGANTLRMDNPRLTVRGVPGARQPWRVVISRGGSLPGGALLFTDDHKDKTLVFRDKTLHTVLRELARREVTSVLIEGGMQVLGEAFDRGLVDAVQAYMAPLVAGGHVPAVGGRGFRDMARAPQLLAPVYQALGDDVRITGEVAFSAPS